MSKQRAWHFLSNARRLQFGDTRQLRPGRVIKVKPENLRMCFHGLHASVKPFDALVYAPGLIACRVELGGRILQDEDKICGSERKILWWVDANATMEKFRRLCLLDVFHFWANPPEAVREYLKTGNKSLRIAVVDAAQKLLYSGLRSSTWRIVQATSMVARIHGQKGRDAACTTWEATRLTASAFANHITNHTLRCDVWNNAHEEALARVNRRLTRMLHEAHREGRIP